MGVALRESPSLRKSVQVIAADPAHDFGITGQYLITVLLGDVPHLAVYLRLQAATGERGLQLGAVEGFEVGLVAIGEHSVKLQDVVNGLSVDDGVGATGVVAYTAADTGAVGSSGIGGVLEAEGSQMSVELD